MPIFQISCRAVLFDMDGVLVDSTRAVSRVWSQWAAEHGFEPARVAQMAQGRPSIATIRDLLPDVDHEVENHIVEMREIEDLAGVAALPGAVELLDSLPLQQWVLVTSSTRRLAEVRLKAAGIALPRNIVTGSDVRIGKPHPEPFLKGAAKIGVDPADAVVIEDSPAGIQAGKAAGCRVLALRTTMAEKTLEAAGPNWIVDDCSNLRLIGQADGLLNFEVDASGPRIK
jgi:sugar-phosphatase